MFPTASAAARSLAPSASGRSLLATATASAAASAAFFSSTPAAAATVVNTQCLLKERPSGPIGNEHFEIAESTLETDGLAPGSFVVQNEFISLDPAMRGWVNDAKSYIAPVALGEVMRAGAAGRVVASASEKFSVGDHVTGMFGVQNFAESDGVGVVKVDPTLAPLERFLGGLGMTGMTAYFGLLDVGKPQEGDTVVVSAAAGAVGSLVGQIAKIKGCKVIGIGGGQSKCDLIKSMGFDAAVDYKDESTSIRRALHAAAPDGINVYFDNVGGPILDAALGNLAMRARVVICGAISGYDTGKAPIGPSNYLSLLVNRARMEGFVVFDYAKQYRKAVEDMVGWHAEGKLVFIEDVTEGGVEAFVPTLQKLFAGANTGKLILKTNAQEAASAAGL